MKTRNGNTNKAVSSALRKTLGIQDGLDPKKEMITGNGVIFQNEDIQIAVKSRPMKRKGFNTINLKMELEVRNLNSYISITNLKIKFQGDESKLASPKSLLLLLLP